MSAASQTPGPEGRDRPTGRPTEKGRRRGRWLIPAILLAILALIIIVMLTLSQRGTEDESEVFENEGAPQPAAVVVDVPDLAGVPF